MARRRRALMSQLGEPKPGIPSEYQQVEYIGYSGGARYIHTGISVNNMTKIVADIEKTNAASSGSVFPSVKVGSAVSGSIWGTLENISGSKFSASPTHTVSETFSKTTITSTKTTASTTGIISLGYTTNAFAPALRFYMLRIYNSDTLLFDGIPCYRKSDSKIGLYDIVGRAFHESSGTWTKGADV